jgi:hypothetical protein
MRSSVVPVTLIQDVGPIKQYRLAGIALVALFMLALVATVGAAAVRQFDRSWNWMTDHIAAFAPFSPLWVQEVTAVAVFSLIVVVFWQLRRRVVSVPHEALHCLAMRRIGVPKDAIEIRAMELPWNKDPYTTTSGFGFRPPAFVLVAILPVALLGVFIPTIALPAGYGLVTVPLLLLASFGCAGDVYAIGCVLAARIHYGGRLVYYERALIPNEAPQGRLGLAP